MKVDVLDVMNQNLVVDVVVVAIATRVVAVELVIAIHVNVATNAEVILVNAAMSAARQIVDAAVIAIATRVVAVELVIAIHVVVATDVEVILVNVIDKNHIMAFQISDIQEKHTSCASFLSLHKNIIKY
jgi:hypothetical protein